MLQKVNTIPLNVKKEKNILTYYDLVKYLLKHFSVNLKFCDYTNAIQTNAEIQTLLAVQTLV